MNACTCMDQMDVRCSQPVSAAFLHACPNFRCSLWFCRLGAACQFCVLPCGVEALWSCAAVLEQIFLEDNLGCTFTGRCFCSKSICGPSLTWLAMGTQKVYTELHGLADLWEGYKVLRSRVKELGCIIVEFPTEGGAEVPLEGYIPEPCWTPVTTRTLWCLWCKRWVVLSTRFLNLQVCAMSSRSWPCRSIAILRRITSWTRRGLSGTCSAWRSICSTSLLLQGLLGHV